MLDEIASADDEMIFRKTSNSVFISTNIDYVPSNLGVRSLIVARLMTDQCVESAVRDACDLGYLVILVTDACTTTSADRHDAPLLKSSCADLIRVSTPFFWTLEGVDGRDKPGQDEVSRPISSLIRRQRSPGQPCRKRGRGRRNAA